MVFVESVMLAASNPEDCERFTQKPHIHRAQQRLLTSSSVVDTFGPPNQIEKTSNNPCVAQCMRPKPVLVALEI